MGDTQKSGSVEVLSDADRPSIQNAEFNTAANDFHTYNININTSLINLILLLQALGILGLFHHIFNFFRSPENRGAPGEVQYPIQDLAAIREALRERRTTPDVTEDNARDTQPLEETSYALTDMSNLELRELKIQKAVMNAEIYTRSMMCSGAGLPCWYPEPSTGETGIVPGDVGTFDLMDGFIKIFNLWDDGFAAQHRLPPKDCTHRNKFKEGVGMPSGVRAYGASPGLGSSASRYGRQARGAWGRQNVSPLRAFPIDCVV
ncbi:hypothetical protein EST38_g1768 [Candolleomyces aberdarensis]|uniref:Uncharacterized protein n=1 Tax=Candolleomyces aberdarensis TaxID=2316362 RepID=A0A4Q2DUM5_9AGAR|nr:hypothetical protein EST38_g1768 [Candolleomyces aberdarensis]